MKHLIYSSLLLLTVLTQQADALDINQVTKPATIVQHSAQVENESASETKTGHSGKTPTNSNPVV